MTQELIRLHVRLARHADRNELASARHDLTTYLHSAKPIEPGKYKWVPTVLFDQLASVALGAGDFELANSLLNEALGADPLDARYQLGYFRARRVLHAAPWHNLPRAHMFEQPVALPSPEDDVEDMAQQLLAALGDIDRQLTLALWVISYARNRDLAVQGLKKALGLVAQAWPKDVERLKKNAFYILSRDGYLDQLPVSQAKRRLPASGDRLHACAQAVAYDYIRSVHAARFGVESMRRVEEAHEGWPAAIEEISQNSVTTYFSRLQPVGHRALRTYLPFLLAEGSGREFAQHHAQGLMRHTATRLESSLYAATHEFLLRDCHGGLVGRRMEELARGGCMGAGATILISHLGLERLVQVQLGERIGRDEVSMLQQSSPVADAIAQVLGRLQRFEPGGDERRFGQRPPFASRPCYANFAADRCSSHLASIELARSMRLPFLVSSVNELKLAGTELPPVDKHQPYWTPVTFPAWA